MDISATKKISEILTTSQLQNIVCDVQVIVFKCVMWYLTQNLQFNSMIVSCLPDVKICDEN